VSGTVRPGKDVRREAELIEAVRNGTYPPQPVRGVEIPKPGGGDPGLVRALYGEMTKPAGELLEAGLDSTVHSHVMTFAAEEARLTGRTVDVAKFQARNRT
jgi:hypothetical protein